ncbi:2-succinyl-6-hydroxy-2,4-cyclohexadiene-1-carboxylate synthase [Sporosarcina ureilytica]|uniref:Putative 2-succinyl-6-hydroxy-2,4-cyclohexadiene-1-carboxylate synthase n=2 Tax=Sporosarcina ureilytica TaxID=298596 RepID=A0A1D8JK55_9BACL|nr:2-succinyl-6-hydroxy-2,4-cyclohexadiene-1-carboxylate synthase [Sporosarcina ureilytica]
MIRGQQIHVKMTGDASLPIIVFLHGFTGSSSTWIEVMDRLKGRFKMVAVDLTGHGKTAAPSEPSRYTMEEQVKDLEELFSTLNLKTFSLVGYSMGGRIALAYTETYPEHVQTLILESASPGLKTEQERQARREADLRLAHRITEQGIQQFVSFWENIPLFESQKQMSTERQQKVGTERLAQREVGLSNSLIGIGTGSQPSLWDSIRTIRVPVLFVTGEIDKKFVNIAREMNALIPKAIHKTVKNAGHAIHVEKPTLFATMVGEHVKKQKI